MVDLLVYRKLILLCVVAFISIMLMNVNAKPEGEEVAVGQEESIEKYLGKEVLAGEGVLTKLDSLIGEEYPGQQIGYVLEILDEKECGEYDVMGITTSFTKLEKYRVVEAIVGQTALTSSPEGITRSYQYGATLSPGYIYAHGNYYLTGTAEFSSTTSWNPVYSFHIGLYNRDTEYFGYVTKTSSPSYVLSYNWDYPYYYAHAVRNPSGSAGDVTFSCIYDWNYP